MQLQMVADGPTAVTTEKSTAIAHKKAGKPWDSERKLDGVKATQAQTTQDAPTQIPGGKLGIYMLYLYT